MNGPKKGNVSSQGRFRTLLAQSVILVFIPLWLVLFVVVVGGIVAYPRAVVSLLIDRDWQLAALSATRVSQVLSGYVLVLQAVPAGPGHTATGDQAYEPLIDAPPEVLQ